MKRAALPLGRLLGAALVLASFAWLIVLARRHAGALPELDWGPRQVAALAAAVGFHLLTTAIGAVSWRLLLRDAGQEISLRLALVLSGLTQAAKYLPGNVGQYVGRTALARRHGLRVGDVLVTLAFETGWLILAAVLLAGCAVLTVSPLYRLPLGWSAALLALAAVLAPLLLVRLLNRWPPRFLQVRLGRPLAVPRVATLAVCLGLYWLSFLASGTALDWLAQRVFGQPESHLFWLTAVFAASWVAGFVTPGAPGGLGVREAVLVAGLEPLYGPGTALGLALVFRLVTVASDGVALLAALGGLSRLER
jgi:uncharacterized membrane protein YbhN (UPF0104 family)